MAYLALGEEEEGYPVSPLAPSVAITNLVAPSSNTPNTGTAITVDWKNNGDAGNIRIAILEKQPDGTWKWIAGSGTRFDNQPAGATGTITFDLISPATAGTWNLRARAGYIDPATNKFVRTDLREFAITIAGAPAGINWVPLAIIGSIIALGIVLYAFRGRS